MKQTIAIVGTGISGMTCAHYLKNNFKITIFDKNNYIGGHTHTHILEEKGKKFSLDTGFIVFNKETYPNLLKLFDELSVEKQNSEMSFSVYNKSIDLQYSSNIFSHKRNLFSLNFWIFLNEIKKFYKIAIQDYHLIKDSNESIKQYCNKKGLSDYFIDNYLVPMSSAIWSTPHNIIYDLPIALLLPFFHNHGLLKIGEQFQWYTVLGGSNSYTNKIIENGDFDIHIDEQVLSVMEDEDGVKLQTNKNKYGFDKVILASHADESLIIADSISKYKKDLLKPYGYNSNIAVLHTDSSIMPPNKNVWTSWNHIIEKNNDGNYLSSTVYWMNRLQQPNIKTNYFLSINPFQEIDKNKIIKKIEYTHPLFSLENFALQKRLQELNKDSNIYFAGSYFGNGFHEDGMKSGLKVVDALLNDK